MQYKNFVGNSNGFYWLDYMFPLKNVTSKKSFPSYFELREVDPELTRIIHKQKQQKRKVTSKVQK